VIGASAMRPDFMAMMVLWLAGVTLCILATLFSLLPWFAIYRPMQAVFYILYAAQVYWMLRRIGSFGPLTAILFPVPFVFFHLVYFRSLHFVRKGTTVTWKGRSISLCGRRAPHDS
jgi:4,4'-diaponeurosporenoate glycosyltransferase